MVFEIFVLQSLQRQLVGTEQCSVPKASAIPLMCVPPKVTVTYSLYSLGFHCLFQPVTYSFERSADIYTGLVHMVCALIALRRVLG